MAKQSGLGDNLYVDGYNLSNDVGSVSGISGGPTALDVTGIDVSAFERLGGPRSGQLSFTSYLNDAAGRSHPVLSALPTTDVQVSYFRGTTLGGSACSMIAKQIDYSPQRGTDGSLIFTTNVQSNKYGLEWGNMLTAGVRNDTTATAGTAYDSGAASTVFGLQAYLHVFAFTGTSVTVKIQESSDNAGDAYADVVGGSFAAASAIGTQRIATATGLTVERYLKVTTTGTFTVANFAVVVVRNQTVPVF